MKLTIQKLQQELDNNEKLSLQQRRTIRDEIVNLKTKLIKKEKKEKTDNELNVGEYLIKYNIANRK